MKKILGSAILIIVLSSLALGQMADKQMSRNAKVERALIKLEEEWHNAYLRHDPTPLEHILADEYIAISGNGESRNKTQTMKV